MCGLCSGCTYIHTEVSRSALDVTGGWERFRDVFQRKGCRHDPHGQTNHQISRWALKRPAVPGMNVRLQGWTEQWSQSTVWTWWWWWWYKQKDCQTCMTARGDCEKYHSGIPNKLIRAVLVSKDSEHRVLIMLPPTNTQISDKTREEYCWPEQIWWEISWVKRSV